MGKEITNMKSLREAVEPLTHEENIVNKLGQIPSALINALNGLSIQSKTVIERIDQVEK